MLDREALDAAPFKQKGGFAHINRAFEERALEVLEELQRRVWSDLG